MSQQTARTMHPFVGMIGDLHSPADYPLTFRVEVLDVRPRFGGTDYHVRPVAGSGVRWVSADRVTDLVPNVKPQGEGRYTAPDGSTYGEPLCDAGRGRWLTDVQTPEGDRFATYAVPAEAFAHFGIAR